MASPSKYGLIAGNGKFPFLVLEAARSQGIEMVVAAIKEETSPDIEQRARTVHWLSLGQLGKLIKTFKAEGVNQARDANTARLKEQRLQKEALDRATAAATPKAGKRPK